MTEEQWYGTWSQKTSIFNAWLKNEYGHKHIASAMLQTGISWAPEPELLGDPGASERALQISRIKQITQDFVNWIKRVLEAIEIHRKKPSTMDARRRSGSKYGENGLTEWEKQLRWEQQEARSDLYYANGL